MKAKERKIGVLLYQGTLIKNTPLDRIRNLWIY